MLELEKQKHNEPRFDELGRMLSDLKDFPSFENFFVCI